MAKPLIRRNTTLARLSFHTQAGVPPLNTIQAYDELALPTFANETSLVGFEFTKRLGEASGKINITLKGHKLKGNPLYAGRPWADLIEEGDWWNLDIIKNGVNQGLSCGRIDAVGVDIQSRLGEGAVVVTVSGRDYGYALEDTPLFFNPAVRELDNAVGVQMMTIINRAVGTAAQVVTNVIKGYMGGLGLNPLAGQHKVPAGLIVGLPDPTGKVKWVDGLDMLSCVQQGLRGLLFTQPMFQPSSQSMWDYLNAWMNPVMNEMYIDVKPLPGFPKQACLILREKPFVNVAQGLASPWFSLRTWFQNADMIASMNVSRGANRINYVSLQGDMLMGLNEDVLSTALQTVVNGSSVELYGLRRLEENTRYMDDVKNIGAEIATKDWLGLIVSWNALNHKYWQGTIVLGEMRVEIRPGDKLTVINGPPAHYKAFPTDLKIGALALTFYVEGVTHRYQAGERPVAQTILQVSRGFEDFQRPIALAAEANPINWSALLPTGVSRNVGPQQNTTIPVEDALVESSNGFLEYKQESNELL